MSPWIALFMAIIAEVIGTTAMKSSNGFTRFIPSVLVLAGYGTAFYLMSQTLKTLEIGTVYAIWSGVGIVATATIGIVFYNESFDVPKAIGIGLVVAGVIVLQVFSKGHA